MGGKQCCYTIPGLPGFPGKAGEIITSGDPERTLFVSPSWIGEVNPQTHFTSISAALTQALTLTPTEFSPVQIIINNGTYPDNLVLISNVYLFGYDRSDTIITGDITWTAGDGPNASQADLDENISMRNLTLNGALTVDTTAKTNAVTSFTLDNCVIGGDSVAQFMFRTTFSDVLFVKNASLFQITLSVTNGYLNMNDSVISDSQFTTMRTITCSNSSLGDFTVVSTGALTSITITACDFALIDITDANAISINASNTKKGSLVLNSTGSQQLAKLNNCQVPNVDLTNSLLIATACEIERIVNMDALSSLIAPYSSVNLTSFPPDPTWVIDIACLLGTLTSGTGVDPITFPFTYPDTNYAVTLTATSSVGAVPQISSKTTTGFIINGSVGGSYDWTVQRQYINL